MPYGIAKQRRRLILHIGTGKTGSTTIQHLLSRNRPALLAQGFCYPGDTINHLPMALQFASDTSFHDNFDARFWNAKDPDIAMAEQQARFRAEIESLPNDVNHVVLSSEQFSRFVLETADIDRFRSMLSAFFRQMTVLVYLRRQDAHFASMYSQHLRRGVPRRPGFQGWKDGDDLYNYDQLLDRWASVFGADHVKPRIFERDTDPNYDVVADVMREAGIDSLPADLEAEPRNQSMNLAGQRMLRDIGKALKENKARDVGSSALWKRLHKAVTATLPGTGWRPTREEARDFVARFETTNEAVRKRWFPARRTLFSSDYGHLPSEPQKTDKREDIAAAHQVILHLLRQGLDQEAQAATRKTKSSKPAEQRRLALMANVNRDPKNITARLDLAAFQAEEGAFRPARHHIKKALKMAPEDERALAMLAGLPAEENEDRADATPRRRPQDNLGARAGQQAGRHQGAGRAAAAAQAKQQ